MMQKTLVCLLVHSLAISLIAQQAPAPQAAAPPVPEADQPTPPAPLPDTLMDGTPVKLRILKELSSADARTGQQISFEVEEDIQVSNVTVIKKGAVAVGIVTNAEHNKNLGRAGKLGIAVTYIQLADNEKAQLRGTQENKGQGHTGAAVGGAAATTLVAGTILTVAAGTVLLPVAPAFLLIKGKDSKIPAGSELTAYIDGNMHLNMSNFTVPGANSTLAAAGTTAPAQSPAANLADADAPLLALQDPGVYTRDKSGAWIPMQPEGVTFKADSTLKNIVSVHIKASDMNGFINGSRARLTVSLPFTFVVRLSDDAGISDYQLLRLRVSGDMRQFLALNGGLLRSNGQATRDAIEFQPEKIADRLYRITILRPLGKGEYGLLVPGTTKASDKETTGTIYTVSAAE